MYGKNEDENIKKANIGKIEIKESAINKIREKILNGRLRTKYSIILFYLGILTIILLCGFLVYNYSIGGKNLNKISIYLKQNLYYNRTRVSISHVYIIFINFLLLKTNFLKAFYDYNNNSIDIYKENYKYSINNIFELTKNNNNFDDDYYSIFSDYSEILINNPYNSINQTINITNFQIIQLIISNNLKFNYNIDDYLSKIESEVIYDCLNANIINLNKFYLHFYFDGFNDKEIHSKISSKFGNFSWTLILVCILIAVIVILFSYIIYVLNYYEKFFLRKIINLNTKEFEDYLKHFEELKYKLKNLENEDQKNTIENDEMHDDFNEVNNNQKYVLQYTNTDNHFDNEQDNNIQQSESKSNENKKTLENKDNSMIDKNNHLINDDDNKKNSSKKKKKNSKKDRVKKIKLIEQKNIKIKKMLRLLFLKNVLNAVKIGFSIIITITYYMIQIIYSNQKTTQFINFNNNIESIESVFTESFINYLNLKIEMYNYVDYYLKHEKEIKNNSMGNYSLDIQTNKNYSSPDFSNLIMELLKDFNIYNTGEVEANIYQLYSNDGCEILYNKNNSNYDKCKDFWSGVISKGLQQTIIEMGSQFSILISTVSLINSNQSENLENILNTSIWRNFDYFVIKYLYNSFEISSSLFDELRVKYIDKNERVFETIFYSYLVAYCVISLIFIYFIYSVIGLFNGFLNFIAIIPSAILAEDKDINDEINNLAKKII